MTTIINLWASPSCGKSTLAAGVFSEMKRRGISCELVTEVAKGYAWEGRTITNIDQIRIAAEQLTSELRLIGKVDYIITDSPSLLGAFYDELYTGSSLVKPMLVAASEKRRQAGVIERNFLLPRRERYDVGGRFQTKEQATAVHYQLLSWFVTNHIETVALPDIEVATLLQNMGVK